MWFFVKKSPEGYVPSPGHITVWMALTAVFLVMSIVMAATRDGGWFVYDAIGFVYCLGHFVTRSGERDDTLDENGE